MLGVFKLNAQRLTDSKLDVSVKCPPQSCVVLLKLFQHSTSFSFAFHQCWNIFNLSIFEVIRV